MAQYYKATIEILVEVEGYGEACDCLSEALRPILKNFEPNSSVIDWRYVVGPEVDSGEGFEYSETGDAT